MLDDAFPAAVPDAVRAALLAPMVDHHCQGPRRGDSPRSEFELLITGSAAPAPPGTTHFDTPVGAAVRRWCAPVLGLAPHASPAVYLSRRAELGGTEVNRRMLREAGISAFLVDTGDDGPGRLTPAETGRLAGAAADEIVRLERIEQEVAEAGLPAVRYSAVLREELAVRAARAAGLKSVAAHRYGLGAEPSRPSRGSVVAAAGRRIADPKRRLDDPVLARHLLWAAVDVARERGLPIQLHCGAGGPGPDAHRADPSPLAGFLRALAPLGVPVVLLDCYPHHRQAGHLANAFPNVLVDVGPALARAAAGAARIVAETLELVPFHKQLFGSGGRGAAESSYLGALYHRLGLARVLAERVAEGEWSAADAERVAHMIGSGNARRIYRL
ncbi:amidohydrolase family protein [Microbispora sp. RL4-1S]|uniref:Amidohydrolase family protein n=2 Tax=Microbispora oryzae TaxID=2806554 RepID=A0A941AIQ9_9ACTN|nr:amidohydrolase family protein [Microbispora oryzae]